MNRVCAFVALEVCLSASVLHGTEVVINELMAVNDAVLADENGDFSDWIELYNPSDHPVPLGGWYLTDDEDTPTKWRIPDITLDAGMFRVIFASGKDRTNRMAELHTNFKLSGNGEYLALVRPDGTTVEHAYTPFPDQSRDQSYGIVRESLALMAEGAEARFLVPTGADEGLSWTGGQGYDDSWWLPGQSALGYDVADGVFLPFIFTDVSNELHTVNNSLYLRVPFDPRGDIESLCLNVRYDDGFIAWLNGTRVASSNAPATPSWDDAAAAVHPDPAAIVPESFPIAGGLSLLEESGNLIAIQALNASPDDPSPDFLISPELQAVVRTPSYMATPTPGAPNSEGVLLTDVAFSPVRGYYDAPLRVAITSNVEGAEIRYTTDFSEPDESSPLYAGLIPVERSTAVRAAAFKPGYRPSRSVTHTYLFHQNILSQSNNPAGWPAKWGNQTAEYLMRPATVNQHTYDENTNFIHFMPSVMIVADMADLFDDKTGIYSHPTSRGPAWERPASVEYVYRDGRAGFGVNCGLRIQGGLGGGGRSYKKKSWRFLFKSKYGPSKLKFNLFEWDPDATREFDQLILRAGANDRQDYTRDEYARRVQLALGSPASHGIHAHVYLNGLYWGMYNVVERPAGDFAAHYFGGGDKDNWDAIAHNANNIVNGDNQAWNKMISITGEGVANNDKYLELQGRNPDGTRNPNYPHYLDVPNHIDYMLANIYLGMGDWPHHNWYAARQRDEESTGYKSFIWDGEGSFQNGDRTGVNNGIATPHGRLRANAEYNLLFGDVAHRAMFHDGVLTPSPAQQLFSDLCDTMEYGVILESARWGHIGHASWIGRKNGKINYLANRNNTVLGQLRNAGLYPSIDAPVFSQRGGTLTPGFELTMTAVQPIYYTLDGSDPREYLTGDIYGTLYSGPVPLNYSVRVKARARAPDGTWSALEQAIFTVDGPSPLRVSELMYHPRKPVGVETNGGHSATDYEFIELVNSATATVGLVGLRLTGGIDFDFSQGSVPALAPGAHVLVVESLAAFTNRYPGAAGMTIAGEYDGELDNGGETVRLKDINGVTLLNLTYNDARGWPVSADGAGHALVPLGNERQDAESLDYGRHWRAGTYRDGSPGAADPPPILSVVLNEFAAHTDAPGFESNDWIELFNRSGNTVHLAHWYLSDNRYDLKKWAIPTDLSVAAGEWIDFDEVTGFHNPTNTGFGLDKAGEQLFLSYLPGTAADRVADSVRYKGQLNGETLGRYADGETDWVAMLPTRGAANAAPSLSVVISEVMYHPRPTPLNPEDNEQDEYIELRNVAAVPVELETVAGCWRIDGDVDYAFPSNTTLAAGASLVLVSFDPADSVALGEFRTTYGLAPGEVTILGPYRGKLSNHGGRLAVEKPQEDAITGWRSWIIVDEVIFFDRDPWPAVADGPGQSLVRTDPQPEGNEPSRWAAGFRPSPGLDDPEVAITRPEFGATLFSSSSIPVEVATDTNRVTGAVQQVEFFVDGGSAGVDADAPYVALVDFSGGEGAYDLTAVCTYDGGVRTSRVTRVVVASVLNEPADAIGASTAQLHGRITRNGQAYAHIYRGLTDGGQTSTNWDAVTPLGWRLDAFGGAIDGLLANATYYYRCFVSNNFGSAWAETTTNFHTAPTEVSLSLTGELIPENGGSATVEATLAVVSASNVTVNLDFGGEARFGIDYTATTTSLTIPAGAVSTVMNLNGVDDELLERPESIVVSIASVENALSGSRDSVTAHVISDDPLVENLTATGITEYVATLNGELRYGDTADVSVYWGETDGGTNHGTWAHTNDLGALPEGPFSVAIEGLLASQTYYYRAFAANAAGSDWADATTNFTTVLTALSIMDARVREGDLGHTLAELEVHLSATSALDVAVNYTTEDGDALAGLDYVAATNALVVPAGLRTGIVQIALIGDVLDELPAEAFRVNLGDPVLATIADGQAACVIEDDDADVHLADWSHRMRIGFDGYEGETALTNFPALVVFGAARAGFDYGQFELPGGGDLRFTDADKHVLLDYEIERWDTAGDSAVWVRLPRLESDATAVWAYWGNSAAAVFPSTTNGATFAAGYQAVYHFAETNGTHASDSSTNAAHGTLKNMNDADHVAGVVAGALDFDGYDDGVDTPVITDQTAAGAGLTFSVWSRPHTANGNYERVFDAENGGWDWSLVLDGAPRWEVFSGNNQFAAQSADLNAWQHIAAVFDPVAGKIRVYKNGDERVINDLGYDTSTEAVDIGSDLGGNAYDGLLDEARISGLTRSADWVRAVWLNMASNAVFNRYGRVEADDPDVPAILIVYGATNVTDTSAWLTARLTSTGTAPSVVEVYWDTEDGGTNAHGWANTNILGAAPAVRDSDLSSFASGLSVNTRYHYAYRTVNADGENWAATHFYTVGRPAVANSGATDPEEGRVKLHGRLTNASPADVTIYFGPEDGGTERSRWAAAIPVGPVDGWNSFEAFATGLLYGVRYRYRCHATNRYGESWSAEASTFLSARPGSGYVPGLVGGPLAGNMSFAPNPETDVYPGPHAGASRTAPPWAGNRTWVYTGQVFLDGRTAYFAENIDDKTHLTIDGAVVIDNSSWNTPAGSGPIVKSRGWYDFELRMSNGGGGAGPVANNGWTSTKGFGMAYDIQEASRPQGDDYVYPEDDGRGTLFRHLPTNGVAAADLSIANGPATEIRPGSARLHGSLAASGSVFEVWAHWGDADYGTNGWPNAVSMGVYTNVDHVDFSRTIYELPGEETLYYAFSATNAAETLWAEPARSLLTAADVFESAQRMRIGFPGYDSGQVLTNFPAVIELGAHRTGFSYALFASAEGHDLRFTDPEGTILPFEIEQWDVGGTSTVWVCVPELEPTGADYIWAYWGNAALSLPEYATNGAVWTDFVGVWHMAQADARDSSVNSFHGTAKGSVTPSPGMLAAANDFDADNDYIAVPDHAKFTLSGDYSISGWICSDNIGSQDEMFVGTYDRYGFMFGIRSGGANELQAWTAGQWKSSGTGIPDGQWTHVAYVRQGSSGRFYVNGAPVRTVSAIAINNGGELQLGAGGTSWTSQRFDGRVDEVRIAAAARPGDWYRASWLNQSGDAFAEYGPPELVDVNLPRISNADGATDITGTGATLHGTLVSTGSAPVEVWMCWDTVDAGTNLTWTNERYLGTNTMPTPASYAEVVTNLAHNTTWFYRYRAANAHGAAWAFTTASFVTPGPPGVNNGAGAETGAGAAVLHGALTNGQSARVTICWGDEDGGAQSNAWDYRAVVGEVGQTAFSTAIAGLYYGRDYYYRTFAANAYGTNCAGRSVRFLTPPDTVGEPGLKARVYDNLQGDQWINPISAIQAREPDASYVLRGRLDYTGWTDMDRDYPVLTGGDTILIHWEGVIKTDGGPHSFGTLSDDGSAIYLDLNGNGSFDDPGEMIVRNLGAHGDRSAAGSAVLPDGEVPIAIGFWENGGGETMRARWKAGGGLSYNAQETLDAGSGHFFTDFSPVLLGVTATEATELGLHQARLNGVLLATGAVFEVFACWGADSNSWEHMQLAGSYTDVPQVDVALDVGGLPADSPFYFTFVATNAATSIWSQTVGEFRTLKDSDGDGVADTHEKIAGTDPGDPNSVFRLRVTASDPRARTIEFPSASNRTYWLQFSSNLVSPRWMTIRANITGRPGATVLTETNNTTTGYYRLRARQ